jgi:hypothetical protein
MASSPTHLENSWASFFKQHPLQTASNQRLQYLSLLYDHSTSTSANIVSLKNNSDLMMIIVASNKKDTITLHHFSNLGPSELTPALCPVALFGNVDIAIPVVIDCKTSFKAFTMGVPSWDDICNASDSVTNFKVTPAETGQMFTSTGMVMVMVMVPSDLGVPIMKSESKDAANIGGVVVVALAHHEFTAQGDPGADLFMACCQ